MVFELGSPCEKSRELFERIGVIAESELLHLRRRIGAVYMRCSTGQDRIVEAFVLHHQVLYLCQPSFIETGVAFWQQQKAIESVDKVAGYDHLQVTRQHPVSRRFRKETEFRVEGN